PTSLSSFTLSRSYFVSSFSSFLFFLMLRRPPRSTLFLHDALPICGPTGFDAHPSTGARSRSTCQRGDLSDQSRRTRWYRRIQPPDRKSTRLNSSHVKISYAVFCLKKKKNKERTSDR